MHVTRFENNPIITPASIKPSRADFKVEGTFNAGVVDCDGQTLTPLRVAESVRSDDPNEVRVPLMVQDAEGVTLTRRSFYRDDPTYDFSDPRTVVVKADRSRLFLTSMSHIRIARSGNGVDFSVDDVPFIQPRHRCELFGCEDPARRAHSGTRTTSITHRCPTWASARRCCARGTFGTPSLGIIFAPDNRDVCLFPEIIGVEQLGPAPARTVHFGTRIWISSSPDLLHWGGHHSLLEASTQGWDQRKVGGGAPMLRTEKGRLQVYHGVDQAQRYCLGALLLKLGDPTRSWRACPSP